MNVTPLDIDGAFLVEFLPRGDARGSFTRVFCDAELSFFPGPVRQANHSVSAKAGTLRGLHCQTGDAAEAKLVRCLKGGIFDVMFDLRPQSPTFRKSCAVRLEEAGRAVFVPPGVAHGFQTLAEGTEVLYLVSQPYAPDSEVAVRYDDPLLGIDWPLPVSEISERDAAIPNLAEAA